MKLSSVVILLCFTQFLIAQKIDIQGHRGARGLLPENTIPAFLRAIDEGVTTLELDVVITKDKKVVVSHESYMSSAICSKPDGTAVTKAESKTLNIYEMTYNEVAGFDCGLRGNPRFPQQQKMAVSKPLLIDLINTVEKYLKEKGIAKVAYNIELKSSPKGDNVYHPGVKEFSDIVYILLEKNLNKSRFTIQSFDFRVLQYWNQMYDDVTLVALIENSRGIEANLKALGFIPDVYSPYHVLLSKRAVDLCHDKQMKVIPWTVNDRKTMEKLVKWGVDGIITDYPDRASGL